MANRITSFLLVEKYRELLERNHQAQFNYLEDYELVIVFLLYSLIVLVIVFLAEVSRRTKFSQARKHQELTRNIQQFGHSN